MKTIALFRRRPEFTRERFRDYYESTHAPLAARHAPFTKYTRNHLVSPDEVGFDALTEFWRDTLVPGPSSVKSATQLDGDRFIDEHRLYATAEERLIAGVPREVEPGPVRRYALMLTRPPEIAEAAFITFVNNWALRLFAGNSLTRVTLDIVHPFPGGTFPADAIVSLWPNERFDDNSLGAAPAVIALAGIVTLEMYETPSAMLKAAQ